MISATQISSLPDNFFSDCWYLYALNPLNRFLSGRVDLEPDQTIEILMTELDPKIMQTFTRSKALDGRDATKVSIMRNLLFKINFCEDLNIKFQK